VQFTVEPGDSTSAVAQRLQQQGLIRNAQLFRLWARYKHLDTGIEPGAYDLKASMTMDAIIKKLQNGTPDQIVAHVLDGWRVTQYPDAFKSLTNFNKENFLKIVKTGKLNDGTLLSKSFWYVLPLQKNAVYALEGYLYPDTYFFDTKATEEDVVKRMLTTLGEHLCPGPASNPDAYLADQTQCEANAVKVGPNKDTNVFTAMKKAYFTTSDAQALYDTLIISSLTAREIRLYSDAQGVTNVYWTRFAGLTHHFDIVGGAFNMGSDPSAQYARDTDHQPTDGKWWKDLGDAAINVDPGSLYNTEAPGHEGLPPGPIANPLWDEIAAAASPTKTDKVYFYGDACGHIHYFATLGEQNAAAPGLDAVKC
jgi:UPF0755 protein